MRVRFVCARVCCVLSCVFVWCACDVLRDVVCVGVVCLSVFVCVCVCFVYVFLWFVCKSLKNKCCVCLCVLFACAFSV